MLFDEEINELDKMIENNEQSNVPLSMYANLRERWYYLLILRNEVRKYVL